MSEVILPTLENIISGDSAEVIPVELAQKLLDKGHEKTAEVEYAIDGENYWVVYLLVHGQSFRVELQK